jgi:glycosyltransferase involved in cell wall biosynthesis
VLAAALRRTLRRLGFSQTKRASWLYRPEQCGWVGRAEENFTIYECYDEYQDQSDRCGGGKAGRNEQLLLSSADAVFTTSKGLYETRRAQHPRVYYAPNGVDYELFCTAQSARAAVADDLQSIPSPRIGYVGTVTGYAEAGVLDTDLLLHVALARPDWSLILIGPLTHRNRWISRRSKSRGLAALSRAKNVYLLGNRPYEQLPRYLAGLDVAVMPFCLNHFIDSSNPLKLWQYLAAGRPVVSTPFREVTELADIVHLAQGPDEFVSALETALKTNDRDRIDRGIALAMKHNWDRLTRRMLATLSAALC